MLVNRGWIAGNPDRARLPEVRTPEGTVEITGLAVVAEPALPGAVGRAAEGKVWQNLTLERYRAGVPDPRCSRW